MRRSDGRVAEPEGGGLMIGWRDNNDGQGEAYRWATTEGLGVKTGQPDRVCELCGQKEPEEGKPLCAECLAKREEDL